MSPSYRGIGVLHMTFRAKTILGIASIEIFLLGLLVLSSMSFLSDSNEKQLIQRAKSTAAMFVSATKDAVLSTDIATLDDLVNDFMTLEDVHYVKIVRHGKVLAGAGEMTLLNREMNIDQNLNAIDDGIFDTRINIVNDGNIYGHIDMGFGTSAISVMLKNAQHSIISIALIEVVLVAIFSFILGVYLSRNLIRLTKATKTLSEHGPGFQLNDTSNDELGELSREFNKMSSNLATSYSDLKKARQEAEDACESKGRFLASMSHEIRTPMNGVLGILSLLEETSLSKQQKHLVNTATESGSFLLSVINDILDFTRMESNILSLKCQPFSVKNCVETVIDSFVPASNSKNLTLQYHIEDSVPTIVQGDINRVRQILHNLIGNAIKFTHNGGITVKVASENTQNNMTKLTCSVSDTGIGIQDSAIDYLFEEFTMVDQTYSRTQEGSGLGLAICKRLCELMGGSIRVTSQRGVGSVFHFSIHLEVANALADTIEKAHVKPRQSFSGVRVLVAEDNKANQLVIRNMLLNVGIEIDIAANGIEAVQHMNDYQYDIVFMDISMPEMDGMEACRQIRKMEQNSEDPVPIIALTAHALTGDKEQFLAAGMSDYLSKPVRLAQLVEKIGLFVGTDNEGTEQETSKKVVTEDGQSKKTTKTTLPNTLSGGLLIKTNYRGV